MVNKLKPALIGGVALATLAASVGAMAEDAQGRLSIIYSPHKTGLSAPNYLQNLGQLPNDHSNEGKDYYGLSGEVNYGKVSLSLDYLQGTSDSIPNALNMAPRSTTFNPLTHEQSQALTLLAGYNVVDNPVIGKMDVTVGYFRLWAQPSISPANWYDGPEIGIKGRRSWDNNFALIYKLGYVPSVAVHGYMKDENLMTGKNILNYKIGVEVPVYKSFSAIGGYERTKAVNRVVFDGSDAVVTFSGFYIGGMYSF